MTLRKQGTASARKDPGPGLGIEHLGGATRVATTLGKVRSPTMLEANSTAAGVLTVSGDASFTNENLIAREAMLSQSASLLERRDPQKEDPLRRYADGISRPGAGAENGGSTIDAEIATLERLNQQDSQLCDELRASCTIGNPIRNAKTSGGQQVTRSCWSLVQGALPKGAFSGTTSPRSAEKGAKAGGKGDGDRDGGDSSSAKKRVFSKAVGTRSKQHAVESLPKEDISYRYTSPLMMPMPKSNPCNSSCSPPRVKRHHVRYDEETTSILTEWFLSHKRWPYPAAKEKDALAEATNLTTLQISNWFTNKRKRHWTPVIKKRTRSPRDFFEFCVMNPKEHSLVEKRENKEHAKNPSQSSQLADDSGGVRNSAYAASIATDAGMSNPQGSAGSMSSVSGSGQGADQRSYPVSAHNGAQAVGFDGRSAGSSVESTNGISVGSGWVHGAGGADPRSGGGGSIALLDHPRPPPSQQQQQQGGPQHPGALAPGLMYASTAARQAANMDPPLSHHQMSSWMSPPLGVDRRSQHSSYSEMGRRVSQSGPLPTSPAPQHLEDPRDDPRNRGYHSKYEIRGFDPNAAVTYQHVQQSQDAYRRGDEASGSSLQSQQLQSYTQQQQQLLQQQQQQLQSQRPANPGSSLGQQTPLPIPGTPASHGATTSSSSLWSSYRAPSPRNLVGTPTYGHHGATNDPQQRVVEPPVSYYSKGMGGTDVAHYPSTPSTHTTAGDYGWRDSASRSEAFPPIAAFVSPNVSEGNGFDMSSVGSIPSAASLDGRNIHQQQQLQQQQLLQTPTDPSNTYYDRSFVSRGWAPGNVGGASLPPPPSRGPNTPDYQRPGGSEGSIGAVAAAQVSDISRSGITSSGWR